MCSQNTLQMNKVFCSLQVKKQGNNTSSPNFAALLSLLSGVCWFLFVASLVVGVCFFWRGTIYFCWFLLVWFFHCWVLVLYSVHELTGGFLTLTRLWNSQISHLFNVSRFI